MPHNFDHKVVARKETVASNTQNEVDGTITFGPAEDELWDVKDIYWEWVLSFEGSTAAAPNRADAWVELGLLEDNPLISPTDVASSHSEAQNSRLLDGAYREAVQAVDDDTNGVGASGRAGRYKNHLRFDVGDMRIEFPGQFSVNRSVDNGGDAAVEVAFKAAIHYVPEPRHT